MGKAAYSGAFMAGSDPVTGIVNLAGVDEPIDLPSGQRVTLQEVVRDISGPDGLTMRFLFVAPSIAREGGTVDAEQAQVDMLFLCQNYALPRVAGTGPQPAQIVISLSDIAVPFGQSAPEATQLFEGYRVVDGACIWEMF